MKVNYLIIDIIITPEIFEGQRECNFGTSIKGDTFLCNCPIIEIPEEILVAIKQN